MSDEVEVTLRRDENGELIVPIPDDWDVDWVTIEQVGETVVIKPSAGPSPDKAV